MRLFLRGTDLNYHQCHQETFSKLSLMIHKFPRPKCLSRMNVECHPPCLQTWKLRRHKSRKAWLWPCTLHFLSLSCGLRLFLPQPWDKLCENTKRNYNCDGLYTTISQLSYMNPRPSIACELVELTLEICHSREVWYFLNFSISFKISTDLYSHESSQRLISYCVIWPWRWQTTAAVWSDPSEYGNSRSLIIFCLLFSEVKYRYFIIRLNFSGVRWCGNRRASHFLHLTYGLIYSITGG